MWLSKETRSQSNIFNMISLNQPENNMVEINTDGACGNNNVSGCCGLIRGNDGIWISGFAKTFGYCSFVMAELWSVF